jgi:hypothetical protein
VTSCSCDWILRRSSSRRFCTAICRSVFKSERCGLKASGGTDVAEVGFRRRDLYRTGHRDDRRVADTGAGLIVDDRRLW